MNQENNKKQSKLKNWLEKSRHPYKLIMINNESLKEVATYQLSALNLYALFSSIVLAISILVISIIVFTPVKKLIPGYGDVGARQELQELYHTIDSLEYYSRATENYTNSLQRILTNNPQIEADQPNVLSENTQVSTAEVQVSNEELTLRNEVQQQVQTGTTTTLNEMSGGQLSLDQINFHPPLNGQISSHFSLEKKHLGVDIIAPKDSPITASLDGWVIMSDWTQETGNTIAIQHANDIVTFYKHNSLLLKKVGEFAKASEAIAVIGNTGELTDGPHLHFEVWYKGQPINPVDFVRF